MKRGILLGLSALVFSATSASAHTGAGATGGLMAGIGHPIGGLDHVLAMVAVGVLAMQMGGRAMGFVPAAFVFAMIGGGVLGVMGVPVPFIEQGILGSVILFGAVIAFGRRLPVGAAMALVAAFAIFHGHAHGTEMPVDASGLTYGLGFGLATASLHAAGLGIGLALIRGLQAVKAREEAAPMALRLSGGAITAAGVALAVL